MKNSILAILAVASLVACKKKETTVVNGSTDSTAMMAPADSTMMPKDSTTMSSNSSSMGGMKTGTMTDQDKMFVDAAAKGGMMEVMLGNIAETNASNQKVKDLGKMMVTDHTKANDALKGWAMNAKYTLPTALDAKQQKMVDDIKMKKGAEFDKAYTALMVSDHKEDIAEFKKEAKDGTGDVKAFASKTLPTLEMHLTKSEEAMKAVK
jgi:putative membrane protein